MKTSALIGIGGVLFITAIGWLSYHNVMLRQKVREARARAEAAECLAENLYNERRHQAHLFGRPGAGNKDREREEFTAGVVCASLAISEMGKDATQRGGRSGVYTYEDLLQTSVAIRQKKFPGLPKWEELRAAR